MQRQAPRVPAVRATAAGVEFSPPPSPRGDRRDFLRLLFKRRRQILLIFLGGFAASAAVTLFQTPQYRASAKLLVKSGWESLYVPAAAGGRPVIPPQPEERINSEIEILRSPTIAAQVIADVGLAALFPDGERRPEGGRGVTDPPRGVAGWGRPPDPVERLQRGVRIEAVAKSNVIEVRFDHPRPEVAAQVVNRLVARFLDHHLQVHRTPNAYEFFREQSGRRQEELAAAEARLEEFKARHQLTDLKAQQAKLLERAAELAAELDRSAGREAELERLNEMRRGQLARLPRQVPQAQHADSNAMLLSGLESRLAELAIEEQRLAAKYTDENRLLRGVRDEIALIRRQIADAEKKRYERSVLGLNATYLALQQDQLRSEAESAGVKARRAALAAALAACERELEALSRLEQPLSRLEREVGFAAESLRQHLARAEESRTAREMELQKMAGVSLIQPAEVPQRPFRPRVLLQLGLGFAASLLASLGIALFQEAAASRLERPEEVEAIFGAPVLAVIAEVKRR